MPRPLMMMPLLCVIAGCTSINADYAPGNDAGTTTGGATSSASTGTPKTTGSGTSGGSTGTPPSPMTSSLGATTLLGSTGDAPACTLGGTEFEIVLSDGNGSEIPPNCTGPAPSFAVGRVGTNADGYESLHCGSCDCTPRPTTVRRVVLDGLPPVPFEECGRLIVWDALVEGECVHAGVAVTSIAGIPEWVAARSLELPTEVDLTPGLSLADREACPSERCDSAGTKALVVLGDTVVEVGESAELVFDGPMMSTYDVFNHRSEVTKACEPVVVWTADRR